MNEPVFFTIVSKNYLAYALTLLKSVAEVYPHARRYLCLADKAEGNYALQSDLFELVEIDELALPHGQAFLFRYDIMELNTAVKPYMFAWLRKRHPGAGLIYLDPDILVLRQLSKVEQAFADGASVVLTPHLLAPMDDDKRPGELAIMRSGVYNCGFVAINAAHPCADRIIDWWSRKLEFGCYVDLEAGLFTDQKWMDLVPGLFPDVHILRDNGYNLAYWNLAQRAVSVNGSGGYLAGGDSLVFVHFSGVNPRSPEIFSKHQDRFNIDGIGELRALYNHYLDMLRKNQYDKFIGSAYAYGSFSDGELISQVIRRTYRRYLDIGGDEPVENPFEMDKLLLNHHCSELQTDSKLPISRLMYTVWDTRADLRAIFNLYSVTGRRSYICWFTEAAGRELGLGPQYLLKKLGMNAAWDARSQTAEAEGPSGLRSYAGRMALHLLAWGKQHPGLARWYARMPHGLRMGLRRRAYVYSGFPEMGEAIGNQERSQTRRVSRKLAKSKAFVRPGANLIGYARGEFGVAENVRSYARALRSAEFPFLIHNFDVGVWSRQNDFSMESHFSDDLRYGVNVFFINADQMELARDTLGVNAFRGHVNIGYWLWELEKFPQDWDKALDLVDEVWAPTKFVCDAITARTQKSVRRMPKAIEFDIPQGMGRKYFDLPEDKFLFLFSYDFNSFTARKNPDAVIAAFKKAFPRGDEKVGLIIKTINGSHFPELLEGLSKRTSGDGRVDIKDGFVSREEMFGLQACIDSYVSLHRSEGFGLGMAESMYLGKPVIATAYSGNMDFMDEHNSCLIDYQLVPLSEGEYPHWQGQHWADASIEHAAEWMARLVDDPKLASTIGAAAATSIRRTNSRKVCASALMARLSELPLKS